MVVALFVPAMLAFFAYLFATGSPDAVPLLLGAAGAASGYLAVHLAVRRVGGGSSTPGRIARGVVLAALCAGGLAANAGLSFYGAALEALLKGICYGLGLAASLGLFLVVLLPPDDSGWVR